MALVAAVQLDCAGRLDTTSTLISVASMTATECRRIEVLKNIWHRACKCYVTHSPATGKIGSLETKITPHTKACWEIVDRPKNGPHLSDLRDLLKWDALSREGVVKTIPISPRRNKELRPGRDFPPSMLLYGAQSLFRSNFSRCHALLSFVTSPLASPILAATWHALARWGPSPGAGTKN